MTYEEYILKKAEAKCNKIYEFELIFGGIALIALLISMIFRRVLIISAIGFSICVIFEFIMICIEHKAKKHVNKRLEKLNQSLSQTLNGISKSNLVSEMVEFKKEYGFLEEK